MTNKEKFIVLVSNEEIKKSDAIILLEGDGLNRISHAISLYKNDYAKKIIFSGNVINYKNGSYPFSDIYPILLTNGVNEKDIYHENTSKNTHEQAVEIIKLAKNNNWTKLIIVASHYHQFRSYLTFLKIVLEFYPILQIINSPERNLKWFEVNEWGKRHDLLEMEFNKIQEYENHVASFDEAIEYQKWKELQA